MQKVVGSNPIIRSLFSFFFFFFFAPSLLECSRLWRRFGVTWPADGDGGRGRAGNDLRGSRPERSRAAFAGGGGYHSPSGRVCGSRGRRAGAVRVARWSY